MTLSIGSLFSGIGGLELGLEWAGLGPVRWQVEIDPFCRQVLANHWRSAARHPDVRTVTGDNLGPVDVMCGGFPCQGTSDANLNKPGLDHELSGLWSEYARLIEEIRPRGVVIENVAGLARRGLARRGLDRVVADLDRLAYHVEATIIEGAHVGAPHRGARVLVVAAAYEEGEPARSQHGEVAQLRDLAGLGGHWRNPPPGPLRLASGVSDRMARAAVRAYGNACMPAHGYVAGMRLRQLLAGT